MESLVALILLHGEPSFHSFIPDISREREQYYIIAANGGVRQLQGSSLLPDLLLGDMDSLILEEVQALRRAGVAIEQHPVQKDKTDGHLALEKVVLTGLKEVIFFGALGGRTDQALANIQLLHLALEQGLSASILSPKEVLWGGKGRLLFSAPVGTTFSLLPLTVPVSGLSITGSRYDIQGGLLEQGDTLGLSNQVLSSPVTLHAEEGEYLVVVERIAGLPDPCRLSSQEN